MWFAEKPQKELLWCKNELLVRRSLKTKKLVQTHSPLCFLVVCTRRGEAGWAKCFYYQLECVGFSFRCSFGFGSSCLMNKAAAL